jgi:hypothetical protein
VICTGSRDVRPAGHHRGSPLWSHRLFLIELNQCIPLCEARFATVSDPGAAHIVLLTMCATDMCYRQAFHL